MMAYVTARENPARAIRNAKITAILGPAGKIIIAPSMETELAGEKIASAMLERNA
jgi:hypothetical protein